MIVNNNDGLSPAVHADLQNLDADDHDQYVDRHEVLGEPSFSIDGNELSIQMRWADGTAAAVCAAVALRITESAANPFPLPQAPIDNIDKLPEALSWNLGNDVLNTRADGTAELTAAMYGDATLYVWLGVNGRWYRSPAWAVTV